MDEIIDRAYDEDDEMGVRHIWPFLQIRGHAMAML